MVTLRRFDGALVGRAALAVRPGSIAERWAVLENAEGRVLGREAERRPATAQIVLANRQNGPEKAMEMVHERAPNGFDSLSDIVSAAELADTADHYKSLAGFDKDTLNNRSSWDARYEG